MADKTQELDKELLTGLKKAKTDRMHFAIVVKGSAEGKLLISKPKIPGGKIAEAKKESGGTAVFQGVCFGGEGEDEGKLIFETTKEPPATLAKLIKTLAKEHAGLAIHPEVRMGAEEEEGEGEHEENDGAPVATKPVSTVAYAKARLSWDSAKKTVHGSLSQLEGSVLKEFPDEGEMMVRVIKQVDAVLDQFGTQLGDVLDAALNATDDAARQKQHSRAFAVISKYRGFVNGVELIDSVENNPFTPLKIRAPLEASLSEISKQLGG